nr:hypothetical protein [Nitrospirota bacterium]
MWYVVLGILPIYGAYNSSRSFGEPWSGLAAGLILAAVLYGLGESVLFLVRKFKQKPMEQNPYQGPAAVVSDPVDTTAVPESVLRDIRNGWIAAVISGATTLIFTAIAMSGTSVYSFTVWELIDVALVFGLAYGIYRQSRVCAILLLFYFVQAKIYLLMTGALASSTPIVLVFLYFFVRAALGTFRYHKIIVKA